MKISSGFEIIAFNILLPQKSSSLMDLGQCGTEFGIDIEYNLKLSVILGFFPVTAVFSLYNNIALCEQY